MLLVSIDERQISINDNIGRVKLIGLLGSSPLLYAPRTGQFSGPLMALRGGNNEVKNRAINVALKSYLDLQVGCHLFGVNPNGTVQGLGWCGSELLHP